MSLLSAIVIGIGLGFALGGRLRNLARLELRWNVLILGSLAIQLFLFSGLTIPAPVVTVGYVASGVLSLTWLGRNRDVAGVPCILAGGLSNFLAIVVNGGRMPVDASLLARARGADYVTALAAGRVTSNSSLADGHTRLPWLTDRLLIPPPWPIPTVLSVGDLVIAAGVVWLIASAMHSLPLPTAVGSAIESEREAKAPSSRPPAGNSGSKTSPRVCSRRRR
jgi:Family of unknown function (DUF5317)